MPDTSSPGATEAQAADDAQPQAGTEPTSQAEGAQKGQAPGATASAGTGAEASIQRELEELRKSEAKYRNENKRLTEAQRLTEEAKLSDIEKLQKRLDESERRHAERDGRDRERDLQASAVSVATRLDFRDPELAARMLDRSQIDWDENGRPRNLERLLRDVLKDRAYLLRGTPDFGGGPRGGSTPQGTDMDSFIRKAAGRPG